MSQTINFSENYLSRVEAPFTHASYLVPHINNNIDFGDNKTVNIYTINTVPMQFYNRGATANRYGLPTEVGDELQKFTMTVDRSFAATIDKGFSKDQVINKAGLFIREQMARTVVPEKDRYCFGVIGKRAGYIAGSGTAVSKSNVISRIAAADVQMKNSLVPEGGRVLYVTPEILNMIRLSDQYQAIDKLGEKAISQGHVGKLFNSSVVWVPASMLPPGVNFMLVYGQAVAAPAKIADTKVHIDPPGISGHLIEYRTYYDCFVLGHKAPGIYVDVDTNAASVAPAPVISEDGKVTLESGYVGKYTADGSDPRYSASAVYITASAENIGMPGDTIKAYQYRPDAFRSWDGPELAVSADYPSPVASAVRRCSC